MLLYCTRISYRVIILHFIHELLSENKLKKYLANYNFHNKCIIGVEFYAVFFFCS